MLRSDGEKAVKLIKNTDLQRRSCAQKEVRLSAGRTHSRSEHSDPNNFPCPGPREVEAARVAVAMVVEARKAMIDSLTYK